MKDVLDELYFGYIKPDEDMPPHSRERDYYTNVVIECQEKLRKALGDEDWEVFERLHEASMELKTMACLHDFKKGFRLGARMEMEIFRTKDIKNVMEAMFGKNNEESNL